jgi:hypothetical protein
MGKVCSNLLVDLDFPQTAQLSATKAIFHTNAKLSDRLDRIEMRQAGTDVASDGVQQELQSLRAELRNTMAACLQALKFGAVEKCQPELNSLAQHELHLRDMDIKKLSPIPSWDCESKVYADSLSGTGTKEKLKAFGVSASINDFSNCCSEICRFVQKGQNAAVQRHCCNSEKTTEESALSGENRLQPVLEHDIVYMEHQSNAENVDSVVCCVVQETRSNSFERHSECTSPCKATDILPSDDAILARSDFNAHQTSLRAGSSLSSSWASRARDVEGSVSSQLIFQEEQSAGMGTIFESSTSLVMIKSQASNNLDPDRLMPHQSNPVAAEQQETPS